MTAQKLSPEELFEDISRFIADGQKLLEQGALVELAGLDKHIQTLCDEVTRLSREDRIKYGERMQQLLNELQTLGDTMVKMRDTLAADIKALSSHKKANVAYRTINTTGAKQDE